jgi:hypothetical protein
VLILSIVTVCGTSSSLRGSLAARQRESWVDAERLGRPIFFDPDTCYLVLPSRQLVQTVKTGQGAGTMAIDSATHTIYLPMAEYEEVKPGATGRPKMIPGTFKILVVAQHASP